MDLERCKSSIKKYRGKDEATDILSFPQYEHGYDYRPTAAEQNNLGDIAISLPIARQNAKQKMYSEIEEITQLMIHGILHLLGFEHAHDTGLQYDCMMLTQDYIRRTL